MEFALVADSSLTAIAVRNLLHACTSIQLPRAWHLEPNLSESQATNPYAELSNPPLACNLFAQRLLCFFLPPPPPPQVVEEAKSVSEALGIPLYRAGDTVPRPPPPIVNREEGGGEHLSASVGPIRAALAQRKPKVTLLDFIGAVVHFDTGCVGRGADRNKTMPQGCLCFASTPRVCVCSCFDLLRTGVPPGGSGWPRKVCLLGCPGRPARHGRHARPGRFRSGHKLR